MKKTLTNAERQAQYRARHRLQKIEVTPAQKQQFLELFEASGCSTQREFFDLLLDAISCD